MNNLIVEQKRDYLLNHPKIDHERIKEVSNEYIEWMYEIVWLHEKTYSGWGK